MAAHRVVTRSQANRRASIMPLGIEESGNIVSALAEHDDTFYGDSLASEFLSSSDSDSDTDEEEVPSAKRVDAGGDDDDHDDDDENLQVDVLNDSFLSLEDIDIGDAEGGLIAAQIRDWQSGGCGCCHKNCFTPLDGEKLESLIRSRKKLPKKSAKLFVVGQLTASLRTTSSRAAVREYQYSHHILGVSVCKEVFVAVNGIGEHVYRKLREVAEQSDAELPLHGGTGRDAHHALQPDVIEHVVAFIKNTASVHGLPQPAAPRGRARTAPIYMPATHRKKRVFQDYLDSAGEEFRVSYRTFCRLWSHHASDVIVMKPRTDVCAICEKLREKIKSARNEEEFIVASDALMHHLETARDERSYYKYAIDNAKEPAGAVHLTFDFAQQLEVPYQTRQVGALYFKVRFRVQCFGVCEEAKKVQVNYLFHEGESIGQDGSKAHGPNAVLSMLDHHLETRHAGQRNFSFHADNCVGQNKNKTVLAYLLWRTMNGLSDTLELNFMRVGHTRCAVDAYFGLLKQNFRRNNVSEMDELCKVVGESCDANEAQRFDWEWREWDTFLAQFFQPLKGIAKYQHFRVAADAPGVLFVREDCMSDEAEINLLKPGIEPSTMSDARPGPVAPAGISRPRLAYLFKQVAEHLPEGCEHPWQQ